MKFTPTGYNDPIFAGAFLGHIVLLLVWIGYSAANGKYEVVASAGGVVALFRGEASVLVAPSPAVSFTALLFGSIIFALVWSGIWMLLLNIFPAEIVRISLVFAPCMFALMTLLCIIQGNVIGAVISAVGVAILSAYAYYVWHRVALTAALFNSLSRTYKKAGGVFLVAFGAVVLQAVWMVVWALAVIPVKNGGHGSGVFFLFLISFYWGYQVIANVLYVAVGGVAARHYFNEQVDGAVMMSTKQASTNYLGSICYGSLIIAVIQALRTMCQMAKDQAREDDNAVAMVALMVADCFLGCLESLAQFFNTYVFAYVAVFGMNFSDASGKVWDLLQNSDADCLMNYSLTGTVTFFACFAAGLVDAMLTSFCAWRLHLEPTAIFGAGLLGFIIGLAVMSVVSYIMEAGVTTLFVCFAESKELLKSFDPELSQALIDNLDVAREKQNIVQ